MEKKNDNDFLKQLDELIVLFEKLKIKATKEGVLLIDDAMYKNFELLAGNYKMIKDSIPSELIQEMGAPIKEMIKKMVDQLKMDLGEELLNDTNNEDTLHNEMDKIDELLTSQNLSEDEINRLLDQRTNLS